MMIGMRPLINLDLAFDEALAWLTGRLLPARLRVVRTFDLQETFTDPADCPCQHPPGEVCSCRMVVLLVYGEGYLPASLVALGNLDRTCFSLVDSPQQRLEAGLEIGIRQALRYEDVLVAEPVD
ncbi:MAG TPA: hypothetical protein VN363_03965 [Anaerolineales bacterium]|nr:hypothetical protein [Anaerolineales bacterium]